MVYIKAKRAAFLFIWFVLIFSIAEARPCNEVVGYYASWKWYKRNKLVNPATIDYSKYTTINYAFFKPLESGEIIEGDAWADKNILLGKSVPGSGLNAFDAATSLVANAHRHHVRVVGSVGGWTWSPAFPAIAGDAGKRLVFANACVKLIRTYNLDGIDIDWEFPGNKLHNGSAADKVNFTLLLKAVREALDLYGDETGKRLILTAAFGPSKEHMEQIEWGEVVPLLDMIHMMTYNYFGSWDKITNHNTPLFPPVTGNPLYSINSTIQTLIGDYHVPSSKINLGLAFYGRSVIMPGTPALHSVSTGNPDAYTFGEEKGTPSYYNILAKGGLFNNFWDATAAVPYMTGKDGLNTFVSYDNPESIRLKAAYAIKMQLLGAVIWDITGDYLETFPGSGKVADTPLCNALHEKFFGNITGSDQNNLICETDLSVYPNPFRDKMEISWNHE